jgi:hypothetical protein
MIVIYTPQGKELRQIPNDEFFQHVTAMELLTPHPEYDEETSDWSFLTCPSTIIICTGDKEKAQWIPRTPGIDIDRFKKYWYLHYCEAHGYSYTVTHRKESGKLMPVPSSHWAFVIYSADAVTHIYSQTPNLSPGLAPAYELKLGAIEICKGDLAEAIWVPITPGLDIATLQNDWRDAFSKSRESAEGKQ